MWMQRLYEKCQSEEERERLVNSAEEEDEPVDKQEKGKHRKLITFALRFFVIVFLASIFLGVEVYAVVTRGLYKHSPL